MTTPTQGEHAQTELAHELFAAAQLAPGEGIEDAVRRIAAALTAAQPVAQDGALGLLKFNDDMGASITGLPAMTIKPGDEFLIFPKSPAQPAAPQGVAPMSPLNRLIAYSAAMKLRSLGFEWNETSETWSQAAPAAGAVAGAASMPPSAFLNAAGIKADDMPGTVVRKLDAAFHEAVTFADAAPTPAAQADSVLEDAAFEAVRKKLCALPRYSFVLDDDGLVRRVLDRSGNWIEFDEAHALFDPISVDAARKQGAKHDNH